jgi:uncharacterized protein YfbU (UPF0304 family)
MFRICPIMCGIADTDIDIASREQRTEERAGFTWSAIWISTCELLCISHVIISLSFCILICKTLLDPPDYFSFLVTIIASIFSLSTAVIYVYFAELRDIHGKFVIGLMSSYSIFHILLPAVQYKSYEGVSFFFLTLLGAFGFGMTFLWISAMTLKSYLRFM